MLGRKRNKPAVIGTLIGADTRVHGDIEFVGGCLIDGHVHGNVTADAKGDEEAMLSVSERGRIEGTVTVPHIALNGTVKGDVKASRRIELGPKSHVMGNVQYRLIEMAIGAQVNGKLIHESESVAASDTAEPAPTAQFKAIGE